MAWSEQKAKARGSDGRKPMKSEEREATKRKKEAEQRAADQKKHGSVSSFFIDKEHVVSAADETKADEDTMIEEEEAAESAHPSSAPTPTDANDEVVRFSEDIDAGCDDDPEITANLDIDPK
jgi:hypothetical protein